MERNLLHKDESYLIRGAVFEVYREMGCGLHYPKATIERIVK